MVVGRDSSPAIRGLIDSVALAVQYILGFTLLAGSAVLIATVQASRRERIREAALLKALGAPLRKLYSGLVTEFVMLGAIAGLVAASIAAALGWSVSRFLLELSYVPSPSLWLIGIAVGAIGIGLCGALVSRGALLQPPARLLSER